MRVSEGYAFDDVSLGANFTCGLSTDRRIFCWGTNWFGSLGGERVDSSADPLEVHGGLNFRAVSSAATDENHALSMDGTLYRWGSMGGDQVQHEPVAVTRQVAFSTFDSGDWPFGSQSVGHTACGIVGDAIYCVQDDGLVRGERSQLA